MISTQTYTSSSFPQSFNALGLPLNKRASHKKSRNGCLTCRERHVRCDEQKPICANCIKAERSCRGYESPSQKLRRNTSKTFEHSVFIASPSGQALSVRVADQDRSPFETFLRRVVPILDLDYVAERWPAMLVKLQSQDSILRQCCIALGAAYEASSAQQMTLLNLSTAGHSQISREPIQTTRQYVRALTMLRSGLASGGVSRLTLRLANVLLLMCASLHGSHRDLHEHLHFSLGVLHEPAMTDEEYTVQGVLHSVGFLHVLTRPLSPSNASQVRLIECYALDPVITEFDDLLGARLSLHYALPSVKAFSHCVHQKLLGSSFEVLAVASRIMAKLDMWWGMFESLRRTLETAQERAGTSLLVAQWHASRARLNSARADGMRDYTQCTEDFRNVVLNVEEYLSYQVGGAPAAMSWNTGLIPMLLLTAKECHDSDVRAHARSLLPRVPRKELEWDADAAAEAAVSIESLRVGSSGEDRRAEITS